MLKFRYSMSFVLLFALLFLSIAFLSSEEYNLFYFVSFLFTGLFIESFVRFLYLKSKNIPSSYEGGNYTTIKNINELIVLKFKVKKADFKNKKPHLAALDSSDVKSKMIWENENNLHVELKIKKPVAFAIEEFSFAEKDLLGIERIIYYFVQNKKKILVLPEAVKNPELEACIKKHVKKSTGRDYIHSIKEYESGDNFKHVNWKQSLKNDKLLVNRFYATENPEIELYVDNEVGLKDKDSQSYETLKENLIYLLNHSPFKQHIKTVFIDNENFEVANKKEELLEKIVKTGASQKIFKKKSIVSPANDKVIVLTTRDIPVNNKVLIRK